MPRQSSASFDEHERPTARRDRMESDADSNATTRMKPFVLEQLVQKGSGTRPVITAEQIDRYIKERTIDPELDLEGPPERPAALVEANEEEKEVDIRDRETVDALTLQRETLIIKPPQDIPIDIDLSRMTIPIPRPAAGRPVPFAARFRARLDQRQLTIAVGFLIAMVSALIGFIAGRL